MKKLHITIPEPCHEDWNKMTKTEKGKFCGVCTKEVIDFTQFSDEQLIKQFDKKGNLCGRFTNDQLNRNLQLQRKKQHNYLSYAFSEIFSLLLLNSTPSKAQEKPKTIQTDKKYTSLELSNTIANDSITVSGVVLDETNIPLPGATIIVNGTTTGTSTDFDGKFTIDCKKEDLLTVSYIGYVSFELIPTTKENIIKLDSDHTLMSIGLVATAVGKKRWIGGNLFTRFVNIFRKDNKNPKYRF